MVLLIRKPIQLIIRGNKDASLKSISNKTIRVEKTSRKISKKTASMRSIRC